MKKKQTLRIKTRMKHKVENKNNQIERFDYLCDYKPYLCRLNDGDNRQTYEPTLNNGDTLEWG